MSLRDAFPPNRSRHTGLARLRWDFLALQLFLPLTHEPMPPLAVPSMGKRLPSEAAMDLSFELAGVIPGTTCPDKLWEQILGCMVRGRGAAGCYLRVMPCFCAVSGAWCRTAFPFRTVQEVLSSHLERD